MTFPLRPAAVAFDAIAPTFDSRFGAWLSVAAQRRAVRTALMRQFPPGGKLLELGGGTGEDATFLSHHGYDVFLTDPSPAMVEIAASKLEPLGARAQVAAGEDLEEFAEQYLAAGGGAVRRHFLQLRPPQLCGGSISSSARSGSSDEAWGSRNACPVWHVVPRRDGDGSVAPSPTPRPATPQGRPSSGATG